jgi:Flp pilus assembly protein TadD
MRGVCSTVLWLVAGVASAGAAGFDTAGWRAHVARLEAAAAADPGDAESALRLAGGYAARGVDEAARRWADEAARRGAHPLRVHLVRGDAALSAGRLEVAVREYFEVVQAAPHQGYAHLKLWQALARARPGELPPTVDVARLRVLLERAGFHLPAERSAPEPGAAEAHTARGFEAVRAGRFADAVAAFDSALRHEPFHAEAHRGLGVALTAHGRADAALGAYRVYLSLTPRETYETRRVQRLLDDAERRRGLAAAGR